MPHNLRASAQPEVTCAPSEIVTTSVDSYQRPVDPHSLVESKFDLRYLQGVAPYENSRSDWRRAHLFARMIIMAKEDVLDLFHPAVRRWFHESFAAPTPAQALGWPPISRGGEYPDSRSGLPILAIENRGERLTPLIALNDKDRRNVLALLPEISRHERRVRAIRVRTWENEPVTSSPARKDLEAIGFVCEDLEMIYYRGYEEKLRDRKIL